MRPQPRAVSLLLSALLALPAPLLLAGPVPAASAVGAPSPAVTTVESVARATPFDDGAVDLRIVNASGDEATGSVTYWIVESSTSTERARATVPLVDGTARITTPSGAPGGYELFATYAGDDAVGPVAQLHVTYSIDAIATTVASRFDAVPTPTQEGSLRVRWLSGSDDARYGQPSGLVTITIFTDSVSQDVLHILHVAVSEGQAASVALPRMLPGSRRVAIRTEADLPFQEAQQRRGLYVAKAFQTITTAWRPAPGRTTRGQLRVRGVAAGVGFSTGLSTIQIKNGAGTTVKTASARPDPATGIASLDVPALRPGKYALAVHNAGDRYLVRERIEQVFVIGR